MINTIKYGTTDICYAPIDDGAGTRREREISAVKRIVQWYTGEDYEIYHDQEGAPHIPGYNISISHSRTMAVVAFDRHNLIGVDAEEYRETLSKVKNRFLSTVESEYITTDDQLLAAWTIKEAVYKIVGTPAVNLAEAILISPDLKRAISLGKKFDIFTIPFRKTLITLAKFK